MTKQAIKRTAVYMLSYQELTIYMLWYLAKEKKIRVEAKEILTFQISLEW